MTFKQAIQAQIDRRRTIEKNLSLNFKERDVDHHTIGDLIGAVLTIDSIADALQFYHGYVEWLEPQPSRTHPAEYVAFCNISWCFGEGMSADVLRMWLSVMPKVESIA